MLFENSGNQKYNSSIFAHILPKSFYREGGVLSANFWTSVFPKCSLHFFIHIIVRFN